jgi:putative nucleotidyltransferase with HDIG domain
VDAEKILVVDDEEAIREVVSTMLESRGYCCTSVSNGRAAQDYVRKDTPDLVLIDTIMPEMDGIELLDWLRVYDPEIPVIVLTAVNDISTALEAVRRGAYDYILKPFEKDQLFLCVGRTLQQCRNYHEPRLPTVAREFYEGTLESNLEAFDSALNLNDAETAGHFRRVTAFTISIAQAVPAPVNHLPIMAGGALFHDIGKMAIPEGIRRKPGPLTDEEKQIMRKHCQIGYNMLIRIPSLRDVAQIVLAHQEFFDGTGYPRGLQGEAIPLAARIVSIADALDAMISDQPYRRALPMSYAREEIRRCAGTQFDPKIVQVFLSIREEHWVDLLENLGSPFGLAQLKNLKT